MSEETCSSIVTVRSYGPVSDTGWDIYFQVKTDYQDTGGRFDFDILIAKEDGSTTKERRRENWSEAGKDEFEVFYQTDLPQTFTIDEVIVIDSTVECWKHK